VKSGGKKNENELIKTSAFSASSISTECEQGTIHFSTLSFDVQSFNPLPLRRFRAGLPGIVSYLNSRATITRLNNWRTSGNGF